MRLRLGLLVAAPLALVVAAGALADPPAPDGAALFPRCAACHTATGAGVPGAFPPLGKDFRTLAAGPEGRRWLVAVVQNGLAGPLTVEGQTYRNFMPAQSGMSAAEIAAVLNHVGGTLAHDGPPFQRFTADEVTKATATASPGDLAAQHAALSGGAKP